MDKYVDDLLRLALMSASMSPKSASSDSVTGFDFYRMDDGSGLLRMDLPGVQKSDIKIEVDGTNMTVSGERKDTMTGEPVLGRRTFGTFSQAFSFEHVIDVKSVKARFEDGVLFVTFANEKQTKNVVTVE